MVKQPTLLTELREFVARHRPHGELHAKASAPTPNGYRLEVACPWCVVFERWVLVAHRYTNENESDVESEDICETVHVKE